MIIVRWWKMLQYHWHQRTLRKARFALGQEVGDLLGLKGKFWDDYAWFQIEVEINRLRSIDRGDIAPTKKTRGMIVNGKLIDRPEEER